MTKRALIGWALIWTLVGFTVAAYVAAQVDYRSGFLHAPLRSLRNVIKRGIESGRNDPASGRVLLEGELAEVLPPQDGTTPLWAEIRNSKYSGRTAVYTTAAGGRLRWPARIAPGEYQVTLAVWAYASSGRNMVSISFGDAALEFAWDGITPARRVTISRSLRLDRELEQVELTVARKGQPFAVIDAIEVQRVDGPGFLSVLGARTWIYARVAGAVLVVLLSGLAWGALIARLLVGRLPDPLAHLVIAEAVGLGLLATATTLLGTAGWFCWPAVLPLLALGPIAGARASAGDLARWWRQTQLGRDRLFTLAALVPVLLILSATLAAFAPAAGVDPQIYHLPIAKWLIREGGYTYHPYQIIWGYPHQISNLFALGQLICNDPFFRTAQVLAAALGCLWILVVYALGKALFGRATGVGAAVLCLGIESVLIHFGLALVDLGFVFFASASILAFVHLIRASERGPELGYTILAALLAGAAAVCKTNGPTLAIALGVTTGALWGVRRGWRQGLAGFALVGGLSLAVAAPMYVKNHLLYGNPLYPFPTGFASRGLSHEFTVKFASTLSWKEYTLPLGAVRVALWPYFWTIKRFVDPLSPGPGMIAGVLLIAASWRMWARRYWPLFLLTALLIPLWFFISALTRFAWPWLMLLMVFACAPLSERPLRWHRALVPVLLLVVAVPVALCELITPGAAVVRTVTNLAGLEGDTAYLERALQADAKQSAPPIAGMLRLNRLHAEHPLPGRVLIDTNLVAYADYRTVPVPYYLQAQWFDGLNWERLDYSDYVLAAAGKKVSDEVMLAELVGRLNVSHVLLDRTRKVPAGRLEPDGCYYAITRRRFLFREEDRFDVFMQRWVEAGLVRRTDWRDSVLYEFSDEVRARYARGE
jgi:hypothetical protein